MKKTRNFGISLLLLISSLFKREKTPDDLKKIEFSTSTQKMGVRFTDKVRDIFRNKWVKRN
ncbi:MAG: hypothetical protein KJ757_03175 [Planctomycetes bacterium]|nr:hypothetical protein [Planctomycetota bacterium]MBU1517747.1 hypothetical protein [Planctomycetota bacterium]MBU2457837.1 hypothetical protein [Planctomycetota bacterium]MBU2596552.1 hypothetical protein [Planctomycetota bacterium]